HYLKILLDAVFGARFFQNEITWKRTSVDGDSKTWSRVSDKIFFVTKSGEFVWNTPYEPLSDKYVESHYSNKDADGRRYQLTSILSPSPRPNMMYEWRGFESPPMGWRFSRERMAELDADGHIWYPRHKSGELDTTKRPRFKRYLDEQKGTVLSTVWSDIPPLNAQAQERLGYPTQKPVALLERILNASSNPGDVVLDPFCGCGTTVHAAEKLGRQWIGIDVTHLAIGLIEKRLKDAFPAVAYRLHGVPADLDGARQFFADDDQSKKEFEKWAVSLIGAQPWRAGRKGADGGIDGILPFGTTEKAVVSVKSGKDRQRNHIDQLKAVVDRERAQIGVFLTLEEPTKPMLAEAAGAGQYMAEGYENPVPKIQIVTIEAAMKLRDRAVQVPRRRADVFRKAAREEARGAQGSLDL